MDNIESLKNKKKGLGESENYKEFFYKDTFYLIDLKKLSFVMKFLEMDEKNFFNAKNLKNFLSANKLLIEEFLDFVSVDSQKL